MPAAIESGPTPGRPRPHRRTKGRIRHPITLLSADTVHLYHDITRDGRPYRLQPSWDWYTRAAQVLLGYTQALHAEHQTTLIAALNAAAIVHHHAAPPHLVLAAILWEYGNVAPASVHTRRRLHHAVLTIGAPA